MPTPQTRFACVNLRAAEACRESDPELSRYYVKTAAANLPALAAWIAAELANADRRAS